MATTKFILRTSVNDKSAIIQLYYQYGQNNRLRYSTGLKIENVKNWNDDIQRIRNVTEEYNKVTINNKLDKLVSFLSELYTRLTFEENKTVTNEILTLELNKFFNKKIEVDFEKDRFLEFLPFFDWFITNYQTNPLPTTKKPLGKGTVRTYRNTYNILKKFNDEVYKLTYKKMTLDFYDDFLIYLNEKNLSANYIGTQIKILKTILNASFEKDFHTNTDFKKRYFAKPGESTDDIYLDQNELLKIYNLDLSNFKSILLKNKVRLTKKKLETARDLFLIGANTGLRVSDFNKLTAKNIIIVDEIKYFKIETSKTDARVTIPINPMVNAILKKRGGKLPAKMPDQHINYAIKEIGKLAEIDSQETKTITKGGKKVIINLKKYDLIKSHTARRSFCTNAYLSGMPTADIMEITTHKSEKIFKNYIKANDLQRAQKIRKHKFFTNSNLKVV